MEKENFFKEQLSGYNLPSDSLAEIRGILTRRFAAKFSEGLSPEGRTAMKEVSETTTQKQQETNPENVEKKGTTKTDKSKRKRKEHSTHKHNAISDKERTPKVTSTRLAADETDTQHAEAKGNNTNVLDESDSKTTARNENDISDTTMEPDPVDKCIEWVAINNKQTVDKDGNAINIPETR